MLSSILLHPKQSAVLGRVSNSSGDSHLGGMGVSNVITEVVGAGGGSVATATSEACGLSEEESEAVDSKLSVGANPVVKSSTATFKECVACEECGAGAGVSDFEKADAMSDTLVSASVIVVAEEVILLFTTSQSFKMFPLLVSKLRAMVDKASEDACAVCSLIESLDDVIVCVMVLITSSIVSRRVSIVGVFSRVVCITLKLSSIVANRCVRFSMVCRARFHCPVGTCIISKCGVVVAGGSRAGVVCIGNSLAGAELGANCGDVWEARSASDVSKLISSWSSSNHAGSK